MNNEVFEFSNGIRVYTRDLIAEQRSRYAKLGPAVLHEPVEEQWLRYALERVSRARSPVFVDVGSALGYYSILVKKLVPTARVISVDPNPQFHQRYLETIRLNGLAESDLDLIRKAVHPEPGMIDLVVKDFSSHLRSPISQQIGEKLIPVEAVTMEQLLAIVGAKIDLMKIDIQGSELELFRSLDMEKIGCNIEAIIVGTHGGGVHRELTKLLSKSYDIAFEEEKPQHQPDGIIVAYKAH